MQEFLPEWEIQEVLANNPKLLEMPGRFEGIRVKAQQRYLPSTGGYIDLLCRPRMPRGWLVVEIKANPINDQQPGLQVLKYKKGLAAEFRSRPDEIYSMVAAPGPVPLELGEWYANSDITIHLLDVGELSTHRIDQLRTALTGAGEERVRNLASRRMATLNQASLESLVPEKSIRQWVSQGIHDVKSQRQLAGILRWISNQAPLFSHEVGLPSSLLTDFESQWFWLFYSAMDRRGNAALFVRGKDQLERSSLFMPDALVKLVSEKGEEPALDIISHELTTASVPLVVDLKYGRHSLAKSIIDAASLVNEYGNDFSRLFAENAKMGDDGDVAVLIVRKLRQAIYGMGPRSAAQFVRGMVLRGPWKLPLNSHVFLENTKYNAMFAGPARLSIANDDYPREAGRFADEHLDGDKGVLSHALWYIRKRYCDKVPLCPECPVAGYCAYYRHSVLLGPRRTRLRRSPEPSRIQQLVLTEFK